MEVEKEKTEKETTPDEKVCRRTQPLKMCISNQIPTPTTNWVDEKFSLVVDKYMAGKAIKKKSRKAEWPEKPE